MTEQTINKYNKIINETIARNNKELNDNLVKFIHDKNNVPGKFTS